MGRKRVRRHTTIHPTDVILEDAMRFVEEYPDKYPSASALAAAAGRLLLQLYSQMEPEVSPRSSAGLSVPRNQYEKVKEVVQKGFFVSVDEAYRSALREILYLGVEPPPKRPPRLPSEAPLEGKGISEAEPEDREAITQWVSKHVQERTDARYATSYIKKFLRSLGRRREKD